MLKYKWYRIFNHLIGKDCFILRHDDKTVTYLIVSGNHKPEFIDRILEMGYTREW